MTRVPTIHSITKMPSKVEPSSAFGKRLTQLRMQRGLTQTQLGELIDASQRAISRYETVAELPPAHVVVKLAKVLKVSADELLGLKQPKPPPEPKQDRETKRLWKKFQQIQKLPVKDQRAVIRLVNSLVAANGTRR